VRDEAWEADGEVETDKDESRHEKESKGIKE